MFYIWNINVLKANIKKKNTQRVFLSENNYPNDYIS